RQGTGAARLAAGRASAADQVMDLRLIVITDARIAQPRSIFDLVSAALDAGAPAIQLRDKNASARELYEQAIHLLELTRPTGALLFINDRLDVALAAAADGVHIGPDDMPVDAARAIAPRPFLIGTSTDDPDTARTAERAGADYIGCGAVFGTSSKDVAGERIGPAALRRVVEAVRIPVVGIGGVDTDNVATIAGTGAAGAAVIRGVMAAADVAATVRELLAPFNR
ncbi:MAG TPA: thiamine phosphate synthase, partial [Longimicrobiales bacterium]